MPPKNFATLAWTSLVSLVQVGGDISSPEPECYKRSMQLFKTRLILFLAGTLTFNACTGLDPLRYDQAKDSAATNAYLSAANFGEQLKEVSALEARILAQSADEPLPLGALGSALLEKRPNSLTAQYGLIDFYQHVGANDTVAIYQQAFETSKQAILASGDGSLENPFKLLSKTDAVLLLQSQGQSIVGSIYQSNDAMPLQLLLLSRSSKDSPVTSTYFNLSALVDAMADSGALPKASKNPWDTLRILADSYDSGARAAIGTYLARQRRYDAAIGWLELASQENNLLAHTLLARIFWYQSGRQTDTDQADDPSVLTIEELTQKAVENHAKAIELGSTESMYTLGRLLLEESGIKGGVGANSSDTAEKKQERALTLLKQAGDLGHAKSFLYLANQYQRGRLLAKDENRANRYFASAANLRNPKAIISYARYICESMTQESQTQILPLLRELADADNAEAMVVIGNLYAKGVETRRSYRRAIRWYKRAVDQAQASHHGDTAVVNEVAWTLAVSGQKGLQEPAYAQSIMDTMMLNNKQVQTHPEYLDTWAATYAANGNFPKAIELQKRALHYARTQDRNDVIVVLQNHLESFEAGDHIVDNIP